MIVCEQKVDAPPHRTDLSTGGGSGWNEGKGQGCLKTKNKLDSQRLQGKNLFFFRFQSPFARTKSTLLPGTSITKFSKASRDRNLYMTSLKRDSFFFSNWSRSTCSVIPGRKIVLQLLQESSMTIERQNCCFVEKQLHLSNKSLRVFR